MTDLPFVLPLCAKEVASLALAMTGVALVGMGEMESWRLGRQDSISPLLVKTVVIARNDEGVTKQTHGGFNVSFKDLQSTIIQFLMTKQARVTDVSLLFIE